MTSPWTKARTFFRRLKEEKEVKDTLDELIKLGEHNRENLTLSADVANAINNAVDGEHLAALLLDLPKEEVGEIPACVQKVDVFKFVKIDHGEYKDGRVISTMVDRNGDKIVRDYDAEPFPVTVIDKSGNANIRDLNDRTYITAIFEIRMAGHEESYFERLSMKEAYVIGFGIVTTSSGESRLAMNAYAEIIAEGEKTAAMFERMDQHMKQQAKRSKFSIVGGLDHK